MLEQFVAVMPGTLAPALLVMSLSVMLTVGEGRDKPISSHWRLIGLIVGLIAAIVFAGLRASAVINQRTFVNYPVLWCAIIADHPDHRRGGVRTPHHHQLAAAQGVHAHR